MGVWHAGEESRVTKKLDLLITDSSLTHLENSGVQHNHDKAGDIEGSQRGIDNKVRVINAQMRGSGDSIAETEELGKLKL